MTFKGFSLFEDVENVELRTWNRCATIFNIMTNHDSKTVSEYVSHFNVDDQLAISTMFHRVRDNGYEKTRAEVNRNVIH